MIQQFLMQLVHLKQLKLNARYDLAVFVSLLLLLGQMSAVVAQARDVYALNGFHWVAPSQDHQDARPLEQGKPIQRELKGGEVHSYKIELVTDQFLNTIVDQRGIDVVVTLFGPDGKKLIEVDSPNGERGPEPVSLVTETAGSYRLEVSSLEKTAAAGLYEVNIKEARPAKPEDRSLIVVQKLLAEAEELYAQGRAAALRKSIEKYEAALPLLRELKDQRREAQTLNSLGNLYYHFAMREQAFDSHNRALSIWVAIGDRIEEAETLNNLGLIYNTIGENQTALENYARAIKILGDLGDSKRKAVALHNAGKVYAGSGENQKALEYYDQALALVRSANDKYGEGYILSSTASAFTNVGENRKALDYYNQALALRRSVADRPGEALTLNDIGTVYKALGESQKAIEFFHQSLRIKEEIGDRLGEGQTLNNLGLAYNFIGENQKAIESYNKSLTVFRAMKYRAGEAVTLNNIGGFYSELGDKEKALDYYTQALPAYRAAGDRAGEAGALNNLGAIHSLLGDQQKALDYYNQALPIKRAARDRNGEGSTLNNIGHVYSDMGDKQKALDHYNQALRIHRETGARQSEATALFNIGSIYNERGEQEQALDHFTRVLSLSRAVSSRRQEAGALYEIARIERDRGNLNKARTEIEAALTIIESVRTKVASQELRASYFASMQKYYEFYIDLLMRLHKERPAENFHALALQANERARARSLIELLAEARANIRQGVDPGLLERERSLQQALNDKADRQTRLLGGKHKEEQAVAAAKEIEEVTRAYQQVQAEIRARSPRYAALTQPVPLSLREIQTDLLDADTMLLEYALGEERSYLWVVKKESLTTYVLPSRREIEEAAREVYSELATRHRQLAKQSAGPRNARQNESLQAYHVAAARLSRMVLAPAQAQLKTKRILLVADGALQYVPFGALPLMGAERSRQKPGKQIVRARPRQLLISHSEIVSLPSASTLMALRRELRGRKAAPRTLAVLADPIFARDDERMKALTARTDNGNASTSAAHDRAFDDGALSRSATDLGLADATLKIPRLPGTRREAEQILELVPEAESMQALDFDASRATAVSKKLGQYKYLHFATHGFLNSVHPELSGIVLSMYDQHGEPQNGFLRVHEVFNLELPAELIVLSACQTGLGKEVKGEGLVGLTRGFMYAGAPRVVVSLWSVSDVATAELMANFYRGMLSQHLRPSAALRAAQIHMLGQKRWQDPYYWAAFTLQGEWR